MSGPFKRLSIKVKTQDLWEDGRETIDRGREMLVTFGKLPVNFRKVSLPERHEWQIIKCLAQFTFSTSFPKPVLNISVRQ